MSLKSKETQVNLAIIGGGLAAQNTLFYLLEELGRHPPPSSWNIIQFHSPHLAPACSFYSTSLCAVRGAKRDTPRGDLLVEGFEEVSKFAKLWRPDGVEWGQLFSLCPLAHPHEEDFLRRFGDEVRPTKKLPSWNRPLGQDVWAHAEEAMFFDPSQFFQWQEGLIASKLQEWNGRLNWEKIPAFIREFIPLEEEKMFGLRDETGRLHQFHSVVFCTGAYTQIFSSLLSPSPPPIIKNSQIQAGNIWEFSNVDWGEKSWALNLLEKKILVYRAKEKKLLISGVQVSGPQWAPSNQEMKNLYEEFKTLLGVKQFHNEGPERDRDFPWPGPQEGKIKVGFRQKGVKRRPFWGPIRSWRNGTKIYGLFSLYKNGLSYSFLGAKQLAPMIVQDLSSL